MSSFSKVAEEAAHLAGKIILQYFGSNHKTWTKDTQSNLVTEVDLKAEKAIVSHIQQNFPGHSFLAEESWRDSLNSEHLWIIDPLDGTNNFANRIPHFCVSIAYAQKGEVLLGVIYNPVSLDLYVAEKGKGAFCNGEKIQVSPAKNLSESVIGTGFYYERGVVLENTLTALLKLFQNGIQGMRRFGSAALDLCFVAQGSFGAFFEYKLMPWDFSAGALIVEEAGGKVSDCLGRPLSLEKEAGVVAASPFLYAELMKTISPLYPGVKEK